MNCELRAWILFTFRTSFIVYSLIYQTAIQFDVNSLENIGYFVLIGM